MSNAYSSESLPEGVAPDSLVAVVARGIKRRAKKYIKHKQ